MPKIVLKSKSKQRMIADYHRMCKKRDVLKKDIYDALAKKYNLSYNYTQQFIGRNK